MEQIFAPLPSEHSDQLLCNYVNATNLIQVIWIADIPNWYFELLGQHLLFEALPNAQLEIHTGLIHRQFYRMISSTITYVSMKKSAAEMG